jgi:hypothetical protein
MLFRAPQSLEQDELERSHSSCSNSLFCRMILSEKSATFRDHALVLLRHKFRFARGLTGAAQHGHRGSAVTSAVISRRRIVAIESGTWRSGRSGGASGSVTTGNGSRREPPGGTKSRGGNRLPLADRESIGGDAQGGMVMEAAPSAAFEMPEPDLLLEFLIVALDAPARLGKIHQAIEGDVGGKGREPIFGWLLLPFGPLDQQPFFGSALGAPVVRLRHTNPHARKARGQALVRGFAPFDPVPSLLEQGERKFFDRHRPMLTIPLQALRRSSTARPRLWRQRPRAGRPYRDIRRNVGDVAQFEFRDPRAQPRVVAVAGVHQHHTARQAGRAGPAQLVKSDLMLGFEIDVLRHARLAQAGAIIGPFRGRYRR